ncbi:MAG: prohibitin family protein [Candidatus Omnitrophica bacterium]|nr:prohibitin family protein [Candidatus Omnitrophota bacterium]
MKKSILLFSIVLIAVALSGCGVAVIEDGQTGVKADFGKIQDQPLNTGWHWYVQIFTWIETWNVKTQEIKETASVPSSEGLIAQLDVTVLYNVPKDKAVFVRKTIGGNYRETVLEPYVREAIRNVVSGYQVKALYSIEGRFEIGKKILEFLKGKLDERGIMIQDVLLRDVRLPLVFSQSIELKLKTEQEALQKEFELQKAKKDAEIAVARAEGTAKSNRIIADSINENYLRYRWVEGLQSNEKQVVYVPTEANLPIMEANRWKDFKTE